MKFLVYGATGSQMGPVAKKLLQDGHCVRIFSRNLEKTGDVASRGADVVLGDLATMRSVEKATLGVDVIALHIPFFGDPSQFLQYAINAIDAAKKEKVKLIVWNTGGTIPAEKTGNPAIDFRIEALSYLKSSGIPHVVLAPTMYAENLLGPYTTTYTRTSGKVAYPAPPDYSIGWLPTIDMGRMIAYALLHPELAGTILNVSGIDAYTGDQLAEAFSEALNEKFSYYAMPPKEFGEFLDSATGTKGAGDAAAAYYQTLWDNPDFRPAMHFNQTSAVQTIPVRRTPIVEWIRGNRTSFK